MAPTSKTLVNSSNRVHFVDEMRVFRAVSVEPWKDMLNHVEGNSCGAAMRIARLTSSSELQ